MPYYDNPETLKNIIPVADPEWARGGGVSHILAEKSGVSFTLFKSGMKIQYFHQ